ncbi:hypothetical protein ABZW96_13910 [Nocardia sp. NPDC004168]
MTVVDQGLLFPAVQGGHGDSLIAGDVGNTPTVIKANPEILSAGL